MNAHTPGPWTLTIDTSDAASMSEHEAGLLRIEAANGESVMDSTRYYPSTPDNLADWQLIAAAPDLLDNARLVLKGFAAGVFVRNVADDDDSDWAIRALPHVSALARLEVAIKKADGAQ